MPSYRVHRMKDNARLQFRWAPHTSGVTHMKPKDYTPGETIEASGLYAAWSSLKDSPVALGLGDILESESGDLRLFKYVGFEEARWILPEAAALSPVAPEPANTASAQ